MRSYSSRLRAAYAADPREIVARFDSVCAETGAPIRKGEPCIFYPASRKVFCLSSRQAAEFRGMKFDDMLGGM